MDVFTFLTDCANTMPYISGADINLALSLIGAFDGMRSRVENLQETHN